LLAKIAIKSNLSQAANRLKNLFEDGDFLIDKGKHWTLAKLLTKFENVTTFCNLLKNKLLFLFSMIT